MNVNNFLSNDGNLEKVKAIYELTQKNSSIYEKKEILQNNNDYYIIYSNDSKKTKQIISYNNNNNECKKVISIIEQLNLISNCENYELDWINLYYTNTYPNCEKDLKIFMLSAIGKLLKENKILKERLNNLELQF